MPILSLEGSTPGIILHKSDQKICQKQKVLFAVGGFDDIVGPTVFAVSALVSVVLIK